MNLRERCERLYKGLAGHMVTEELERSDVDLLESFAREIRNESLEEAAMIVHYYNSTQANEIRALKSQPELEGTTKGN